MIRTMKGSESRTAWLFIAAMQSVGERGFGFRLLRKCVSKAGVTRVRVPRFLLLNQKTVKSAGSRISWACRSLALRNSRELVIP